MTELSNSDGESLSSTHGGGVNRLYTFTLLSQNRLDDKLDSIEEKKVHFQQLEKKYPQAEVQTKILWLEGKKSYGFVFEKAPTKLRSSRLWLDKNVLVLKKAKETKRLDVYTGQS